MDVLVPGFNHPKNLSCDACGSTKMKRLVSQVNYHSSHADRVSGFDPNKAGSYRDTRNIGLHAEQMLKKSGVEPTDGFKAKLEGIRTDPSSVIRDHKE